MDLFFISIQFSVFTDVYSIELRELLYLFDFTLYCSHEAIKKISDTVVLCKMWQQPLNFKSKNIIIKWCFITSEIDHLRRDEKVQIQKLMSRQELEVHIESV